MGRSTKWEAWEDTQLAKSWIAMSENAIQGNEQTRDGFWASIREHWLSNLGRPCKNERSATACRNRWNEASRKCQKFAGFLTQVENMNISGTNAEDAIKKAHQMYTAVQGDVFILDHVWSIVKTCPKWSLFSENRPKTPTKAKRSNESLDSTASDESNEENEMRRGVGVKKAKASLAAGHETAKALKDLENQQRIKNEQFSDFMMLHMLQKPLDSIPEENRAAFLALKSKYGGDHF